MKRILLAVTCDARRAEMLLRHPDYSVVFSAPDCTQRLVMDAAALVGDHEYMAGELLLLRLDQVAHRLQLSPRKVADLVADGELDSVKVGGARRVRAVDLANFVERLGHIDTRESG